MSLEWLAALLAAPVTEKHEQYQLGYGGYGTVTAPVTEKPEQKQAGYGGYGGYGEIKQCPGLQTAPAAAPPRMDCRWEATGPWTDFLFGPYFEG